MKTPSVPHLPREVHHFVRCRQEEPGREDFKPAKWRSKSLQRKRKKRKISQKSKAKLPLQCQDRCSSERPLQAIQTGQRCFFWANKVFLISKKFSLKDTFNVHHIHQNIVWNFQWKFSPSSRLCLCNNRFWCPSSSLSSQVYIWAKTDGVGFCSHFTSPRKNPLNNFSGLCQFCLLLYVSTICNTVFQCFIFPFQSNGQSLTKSTSAAS